MARPNIIDHRMTGEEFDAWYAEQPDGHRYELMDGIVYPNFDGLPGAPFAQAERVVHNRLKLATTIAMRDAIRARRLPCQVFADGMPVLAGDESRFEPDVMVRCGPRLPDEATLVLDPVIVVEVTSPSTKRVDALAKFAKYFGNPTIMHYLIVLTDERRAIHHRRAADGTIVSAALGPTEAIRFEPPGIDLDLGEIFADLD